MKKWILSKIVTPTRVRKVVAGVLSWLIYTAVAKGAWDVVRSVARWMRKLADFIESWSATELPSDKDHMLYDLVADAITDEAVDLLVERVAAMRTPVPEVCDSNGLAVTGGDGYAPVRQ